MQNETVTDDNSDYKKADNGKKIDFINREKELDKLTGKLKNLREEEYKVVLLAGELGLGKSTLLDKLENRAKKKDFEIIRGRCIYGDSQPYQAFQDAWTSSKNKPLPSIEHLNGKDDVELDDKEMLTAHRNAAFFETAEDLIKETESKPQILMVEDIHLADKGTLNLFNYLSDRLQDEPILFIASYQPGDATRESHFVETKNEMSRNNLFEEIELGPFNYQETKRLAKCILELKEIPEEFLQILYEKTNGNPLFVIEGIRHMEEIGVIDPKKSNFPKSEEDFLMPNVLEEMLERRIFRIDIKTREVLQLGSVIGNEVPFNLLQKSSEFDELELLDHVDRLIENKLWKEMDEEEGFKFSHKILKDKIYDKTGQWVERQRLHIKVAKAIEEVYEDELEKKYLSLAKHYDEGEEYSKAINYYMEGAKDAENMYAHEDAVEMFDKALKLSQKTSEKEHLKLEILEDMAQIYRLLGDYEEGKTLLYQALSLVSDFEEKQRIYLDIVKLLQDHGEFEKALDILDERLAVEDEDSEEKVKFLGRKGWSFMKMGKLEQAEDTIEKGIEISESIGKEEIMADMHHLMGTLAMQMRKFNRAKTHLEIAKETWEKSENLKKLSKTINNLSGIYAYGGDLDRALSEFKKSLDLHKKIRDKSKIHSIYNNIGLTYMKKGDLEKAVFNLRKSYSLSDQIDNKFSKGHNAVNLGRAFLERGDLERAEKYIKEGKKLSEKTKHLDKKIQSEYLLGRIALEKNKLKEAKEHLENLTKYASERDEVKDKGNIQTLKGFIYGKENNLEQSIKSLKEAEKLFKKSNLLDEWAITKYKLGKILKKKGDIEKSKENIRDAQSYFEDRDMQLWSKRCKEVLKN